MARFTVEDKLSAVNRYLEGTESYRTIATSLGISDSEVRKWVRQYQHHGKEILFKKTYTSYSTEFKLNVLEYMNEHGTSTNETAAIFKITSSGLIRKWRTQFESHGIDGLKSKKKGHPTMKKKIKSTPPVEGSIEALKIELEQLRMENAYLKKLNALVQNKEALQNKTKRK